MMFVLKNVRYHTILDIDNLVIHEGVITSFIGHSGSGKTTILRMLCKLTTPTEGIITYNGEPLTQIDSIKHRQSVVMLSQKPHLFPGTIEDNLIKGLTYHQKTINKGDLDAMLAYVNLNKPLTDDASILSGGEAQRLALARVLLLDAKVYLMDEPSSALDDDSEQFIIEKIVEFVKEKQKTLVMVTHNKTIAKQYSDHIISIENGHVKAGVQDGK